SFPHTSLSYPATHPLSLQLTRTPSPSSLFPYTTLFRSETAEGLLFAAFEFVPGATLREVLDTEGRLQLPEALHLMTQVLDAQGRSEEHTSELQSLTILVCRLLLAQ